MGSLAPAALKILIVDDNPEDRFAYQRWLRRQAEVEIIALEADSGAAGLQMASDDAPDCILLDFNLPDVDGIRFIHQLRQKNRHTAVVMLTGLNDAMTSVAALHAGADDFLVKGRIDVDHLYRSIIRAVEHRSLSLQLAEKQARLERFASLINRSPDLLMISCLSDGRLTEINDAGCRLLGYDRELLVSGDFDLARVIPAAPGIAARLESASSEIQLDCDVIRRDGTRLCFELSGQVVFQGDERYAVIVGRDVTAARAQTAKLTAESRVDGLTGVSNRRAFDELLERLWRRAAERRKPLSMLMIDIDHFKPYNDLAGHQAGDACLRLVAATLKQGLRRENEHLARFGGEEFAVLLFDHADDRALQTAQALVASIREQALPHPISAQATVSVSIGCATCLPPEAATPGVAVTTLVEQADQALYRAKHDGCDCVRHHLASAKS